MLSCNWSLSHLCICWSTWHPCIFGDDSRSWPNSTTSTDRYNDLLHSRRGKRHCHCSTFVEGNETNYAKVKEKFDQHFIVKRNVIFERAKFNMRTQEPGKPIDVFITDPYGLSEHCEFGAIREELIRDRRGGVTRCKAKRKTPNRFNEVSRFNQPQTKRGRTSR